MTTLTRLLYVSVARDGLGTAEVERLLGRARAFNQALGVGGCLLFYGGRFLQVLEGSRSAVQSVLGRIQADPRHHGLRVLYDGPTEEREFADWSMRLLTGPAGNDRAVTSFLAGLDQPPGGRDPQDGRLALALLKRLGQVADATAT